MEIKIIIAGFLTLFVAVGHFIFGISWYLNPMLKADFDQVPKATLQSVFHYVSVFLVLAASALLMVGFGKLDITAHLPLVRFIGANFILFAIVQIAYSFINKVPRPLISMFQWTMFVPIGLLCLL
ncbi:MAG: hypothetical protein Kow00108_26340 [Calditrichia bacterium]